MHLYRGQTVQRLGNRLVGQLESFFEALALYHLGRHRAGRDCRAAAEGLELDVLNDAVVRNLEVNLHDVAALCVADLADAVRVLDLTDIARMGKMVKYLFTVLHKIYLLFVQSNEILCYGEHFCALNVHAARSLRSDSACRSPRPGSSSAGS